MALNLNDFNLENQKVLSKTESNTKTKERLTEKLQISVTATEYAKIYAEFEASEFPTFGGWLRVKLSKGELKI